MKIIQNIVHPVYQTQSLRQHIGRLSNILRVLEDNRQRVELGLSDGTRDLTVSSVTASNFYGLGGIGLLDATTAYYLTLLSDSTTAFTADRTLTLDTDNASRILKITGNPTIADWFDQSVKNAASPSFYGAFVGATASSADFPSATAIFSKGDTGQSNPYNIGIVGESQAVQADGQRAFGVAGVARTDGDRFAIGVYGDASVKAVGDAQAFGGYFLSQGIHGAANYGIFSSASGSTDVNYSFYSDSGLLYNTGPIETAATYKTAIGAAIDEFSIDGTLAGNSDTALPTEKAVKTYSDTKVASNAAIVAATKSKITYDTKGLVTAGADVAQADTADMKTTDGPTFDHLHLTTNLNMAGTLTNATNATYSQIILSTNSDDNIYMPYLFFYKGRGTINTPTATQSGDYLFFWNLNGQYDSTVGHLAPGAWIYASAAENFSSATGNKTNLIFSLAGTGVAPTPRLLLYGAGSAAFSGALQIGGALSGVTSVSMSGNVLLSSSAIGMRLTTADGSDDGYVGVGGGGDFGVTRGGAIYPAGNEYAGGGGAIWYVAGNVATGDHIFQTGNSVERLRITYAGNTTASGNIQNSAGLGTVFTKYVTQAQNTAATTIATVTCSEADVYGAVYGAVVVTIGGNCTGLNRACTSYNIGFIKIEGLMDAAVSSPYGVASAGTFLTITAVNDSGKMLIKLATGDWATNDPFYGAVSILASVSSGTITVS